MNKQQRMILERRLKDVQRNRSNQIGWMCLYVGLLIFTWIFILPIFIFGILIIITASNYNKCNKEMAELRFQLAGN